MKKPTGELYNEGKSIVFFPLVKGGEGKDYVFNVYNNEVKKSGGEGVVAYGKAAVTTSVIIGADTLSWMASFLQQKKKEVKEVKDKEMGN